MDIQLLCSDTVKEKISRTLAKTDIHLAEEAKIVMVERGFAVPAEKIAVVFESSDYLKAFDLLLKYAESDHSGLQVITGFSNNRYSLIPVADMYHIDAHGSEITCSTAKETYYLKNTLQYYEGTLNNRGIMRINKSQLVNIMNVREIIPWFNARLVLGMKNGTELEVSKYYAKFLRKTLIM
jgi:two-component system response regulator LytT